MQINSKFYYAKKYQPIIFVVENYILFQLYKDYNILSISK